MYFFSGTFTVTLNWVSGSVWDLDIAKQHLRTVLLLWQSSPETQDQRISDMWWIRWPCGNRTSRHQCTQVKTDWRVRETEALEHHSYIAYSWGEQLDVQLELSGPGSWFRRGRGKNKIIQFTLLNSFLSKATTKSCHIFLLPPFLLVFFLMRWFWDCGPWWELEGTEMWIGLPQLWS